MFVKTNGILSGGSVRLSVYRGQGGVVIASSAAVTDTTAYESGWQRLTVTYVVPAGTTTIRVQAEYVRTSGVAESFWIEEINDPRATRPLLCEFVELAAPLREPGPFTHRMRP
jgi:hypothetical protein